MEELTDEVRRKREEEIRRRHEDNARNALTVLNVVELTLTRYKDEDDPVLRYSLVVDKLLLLIEIGMGVGRVALNEETGESLEVMGKFDKLTSELQKELKGLMHWIKSPIYSPDHPFGNQVMKESERSFQSEKESTKNIVV